MQFINFAWEIYQDDSNWVAPLKSDLLKVFLGLDISKKLDYGPQYLLISSSIKKE